MSSLAQLKAHNKREAKRLQDLVRMVPRVIAFFAADSALVGVMQPAARNSWGAMFPSGVKTVHGSSNAAWNWRVTLHHTYLPQLNDKGRRPIGQAFDVRSDLNDPEMYEVIKKRRDTDVKKVLYKALFSKSQLANAMPKISLYNAIPVGSSYAENANLKAAESMAISYAKTGQVRAEVNLSSWLKNPAITPSQIAAYVLQYLPKSVNGQ